jgi:hypothetical protein
MRILRHLGRNYNNTILDQFEIPHQDVPTVPILGQGRGPSRHDVWAGIYVYLTYIYILFHICCYPSSGIWLLRIVKAATRQSNKGSWPRSPSQSWSSMHFSYCLAYFPASKKASLLQANLFMANQFPWLRWRRLLSTMFQAIQIPKYIKASYIPLLSSQFFYITCILPYLSWLVKF